MTESVIKENVVHENNKRIAKNAITLYFRMFFSMGVSLYTSRVILNTLGVEDFGTYNVVGGVVLMFGLISNSLSSASQRFITFELGKKDQKLKEVFSITITVHFILALIILLFAETVGIWFLDNHINVNMSRMSAARWVYQCSVLSFLISLLNVPYNASIIAKERINVFALIGIGEVLLKFLAIVILPILPVDKLKAYAILIALVALIISISYRFYCKKQFDFCSYVFTWGKKKFKHMANFAGWNFIGVSAYLLMTQGINILLNVFFGVTVNAARGIVTQVDNIINQFVNNFTIALNPQITKSYAKKDIQYMHMLVINGAKYSYFLMIIISIPILFETNILLKLWLKTVPVYTVSFLRFTILLSLFSILSNTLITSLLSTGNIKKYQLIVGGIGLTALPVSYVFFKLQYPAEIIYLVQFIIFIFQLVARLYLLRELINLPIKLFLKEVLIRVFFVTVSSMLLPLLIFYTSIPSLTRLIAITFISGLTSMISIYLFGLDNNEQLFVKNKCLQYIKSRFVKSV